MCKSATVFLGGPCAACAAAWRMARCVACPTNAIMAKAAFNWGRNPPRATPLGQVHRVLHENAYRAVPHSWQNIAGPINQSGAVMADRQKMGMEQPVRKTCMLLPVETSSHVCAYAFA